jgi:cytochrome b subunit of formate dehydrogenase
MFRYAKNINLRSQMQPLVKIFEAIGAIVLYVLTILKFAGAFLLVSGIALFIPFFFIEYSLGYDLFGLARVAETLIDWGYTAVLVGISILALPLCWLAHDLRTDPMVLGILLLLACAWIGTKILKAYFRHLSKH